MLCATAARKGTGKTLFHLRTGKKNQGGKCSLSPWERQDDGFTPSQASWSCKAEGESLVAPAAWERLGDVGNP